MTFSIVARDPKTGEIGVAVQSHYFSVGSVVPWARAGVGAVATQSNVDVRYGPLGLALMAGGMSAPEALQSLLKGDAKAGYRQVAMVDSKGGAAAHTGPKCIPSAGHTIGEGFSCQGNIMANETVWKEMGAAFQGNGGEGLPERLMRALEAGQAAGGDLRGKQSAAMLVVAGDLRPGYWEGRVVDLRVEDSPEPLSELRRLIRYQQGYRWADRGDDLLSSGKEADALDAYAKAMELVPGEAELKYWVGIGLVSSGKGVDRGVEMLREVCRDDPNWVTVTEGILKIGYPPLESWILDRISG